MFSWSAQRQFLYGGIALLVVLLISGGVFFKAFYHSPTCSDGIQNGDEKGVDCGGACQLLCKSDALNPIVLWSKVFNISGDVYNAVAYIENPNVTSRNPKAEYEFKIYDKNHALLGTRTGFISIPKNKKFSVFEPAFVFKNKQAKYAEFSFTSFSSWIQDVSPDPELEVVHSALLATSTVPRIEGTLSNKSLEDVGQVELVAFVEDSKENVVASARTFVDSINKKTSEQFVFTWPKPFDFGVESCINPLDVMLVLDRSGSMRSESVDPPEPFSTVIQTAKEFVKNLSDDDRVGIISFGTTATKETALGDKISAERTLSSLSLSTTTLEQTNITESLTLAHSELDRSVDKGQNKKVIILLTDGVPTEPVRQGEADYPKSSAERVAQNIHTEGIISLYTIGLGKGTNEGFLKNLSGDESKYFFAPNKEMLGNIYSTINASLCEKKPNVIQVMYRIL